MLELEESFFAIRVHIVRDRRTAERNRFLQHFFDGHKQLPLLIAGVNGPARAGRGRTTSPKKRLISINVADAAQQFLIEQRALDGSLAAAKQRQEAVEIDFQRLDAGGVEVSRLRDAQTAEAAGIDEAQFPAPTTAWRSRGYASRIRTAARLSCRQPIIPKWTIHWARLGVGVCGTGALARRCLLDG